MLSMEINEKNFSYGELRLWHGIFHKESYFFPLGLVVWNVPNFIARNY